MKNGTTADQNQDGRGLPATRIETIADGSIDPRRVRFVELDAAGVERWKLLPGDILLSHINSVEHIGKSAIYLGAPETLIHGMNLLLLRPDRSLVMPEYLHFGLRSHEVREHIRARCKRAINQASINQKELGAIELPVPTLPEQRRIVDLLSRAEGIVRLRREAEKKAAELIPALFLDMFGDPTTNPKGWAEQRLGDIAAVVSGVTKGRKFGDKKTVEVPYLRVANVQAGHINLTVVKTIEVLPQDVQQLALQHGDVVLTEGGDFDKLGRGALWEHDIPNCIHQNHVFRVRLNNDIALPEFFVTYLQAGKAREYFLRSAKRTTNLASINMTQLRDLPVVLPALSRQQAFAERFSAARSIQLQQSSATAKAQATFGALLASVFAPAGFGLAPTAPRGGQIAA